MKIDHQALDSISPYEADLPPSARTWARIIRTQELLDVLEMRNPNDGSGDPADCARHQYVAAGGTVFSRRLPPAPLDQPEDETPWRDDPSASDWRPCEAAPSSPIWEILRARPAPTEPEEGAIRRNLDGTGERRYRAWRMPRRNPADAWSAITNCPCPVQGCGQTLVWYEAGYVPGYRVCMAAKADTGSYDARSLRHRFVLVTNGDVSWYRRLTLALVRTERKKR